MTILGRRMLMFGGLSIWSGGLSFVIASSDIKFWVASLIPLLAGSLLISFSMFDETREKIKKNNCTRI